MIRTAVSPTTALSVGLKVDAGTLAEAVDHYVQLLRLSLTPQQRADLVEYLKTL